MPKPDHKNDLTNPNIDWSKTSFEGAELEAMRRWAKAPLEEVIRSLEEMQDMVEAFDDLSALGQDPSFLAEGRKQGKSQEREPLDD